VLLTQVRGLCTTVKLEGEKLENIIQTRDAQDHSYSQAPFTKGALKAMLTQVGYLIIACGLCVNL
jgi:hypothetical protein